MIPASLLRRNIFVSIGLVVVLLTVLIGCSAAQSATSVVTAFYKAGNSGDYSKAKSLLMMSGAYDQMNLGFGSLSFERGMDGITKGGKIASIEVKGGDSIGQNYAVVYATLHYNDGTQAEDTLQLMNSGDGWKIYLSNLLITNMAK